MRRAGRGWRAPRLWESRWFPRCGRWRWWRRDRLAWGGRTRRGRYRWWEGAESRRGPAFRIGIGLDPGADGECLAVVDGAIEDGAVSHEDVGAAVGEDAADLGEREHGVERNGDAAGADNGEKPMEALRLLRAIDGDGLARLELDGATEKRIHAADFGVQLGEAKGTGCLRQRLRGRRCAGAVRRRDWLR